MIRGHFDAFFVFLSAAAIFDDEGRGLSIIIIKTTNYSCLHQFKMTTGWIYF